MKILRICVFMLLLVLCILLSACGHSENLIKPLTARDCYISKTDSLTYTSNALVKSFKGTHNWYYIYYLGTVGNVPLQPEVAGELYQGGGKTKTYTISKVTVESVSRATSVCYQETTGTQNGIEIGISLPISTDILDLQGNLSLSLINKTEVTRSTIHGFQQTVTEINSYIEKTEYTFDKEQDQGYYRYIAFGDVDEYVIVCKNPETGQYSIATYTEIRNSAPAWEYSSTSDFGRYEYPHFEFAYDESTLSNLQEPTGFCPIETGSEEFPYRIYTKEDFCAIGSHPTKHYILMNDIDFEGKTLAPVAKFSGCLDGGLHKIYNFTIISSPVACSSDGSEVYGLFGTITSGGVVKNLQIGNSGQNTSIVDERQDRVNRSAGMIAGYCAGTIQNCRVVNCSIKVVVYGNNNTSVWCNVGGICGTLRGGTVSGCYVTGGSFESFAEAAWDQNTCDARTGGIVGYAAKCTIENCLVESLTSLTADAKISAVNQKNKNYATAEAGGLAGHTVKEDGIESVVKNCVVRNITINSSAQWVDKADGAFYGGCLVGRADDTTLLDNVVVGTCTITHPNSTHSHAIGSDYGFQASTLTSNSYNALKNVNSAFASSPWKAGTNNTIALSFDFN